MPQCCLECRNLRYNYPTFRLDMTFSVEAGELLCIIGPSGSGKSTVLSLIAGILNPESGSIFLNGRDITELEISRRHIGMVFQDFSLFPSMNVAKNIRYGMKEGTAEEKERNTTRLMELVGLPEYGTRQVYELSGGEAQRVALARAIAAKPDVLLLDEPLSALDAPLRRHLRSVIRQIHDETGIAMIYVTHDREEAFAIADRLMVMRRGNVEAIGTAEQIYKHPSNLFVANFTGDGSFIPAELLFGEKPGKALFFRPENTRLETQKTSPDTDDIVLYDAKITNVEYNGSGYTVKLSWKDCTITAMSQLRPEKDFTDVHVNAAAVSFLDI